MKCPKCLDRHRRVDGMRCSCGYEFVLDPKVDGYADNKLVAAARRASGNGERYFTSRQIATEVMAMRGSGLPAIGCGTILLLFVLLMLIGGFDNPTDYLVPLGFFLLSLFPLYYGFFGIHGFDQNQFKAVFQKYIDAKGPFPKMLRNDRPLATPPPEFNEDDLYDYGVEGILFTQRPLVCDLLVLNGVHELQRIVIIDESGYPDYLVPRVNRILTDQPEAPVFVLHDANASGERMASRLQQSSIFDLANREITDLGLRVDDLKRLPKLKRLAREDGDVAIDYLKFDKLQTGIVAAVACGELPSLVEHIGRDPDSFGLGYG